MQNNLYRKRNAYILLAPNFIFLFVFLIGPFFWFIGLSFQKGSILGEREFVGLLNYFNIFTNPLMLKAIGNTLLYTVIVIPFVFILGMCCALLLNYITKLQNTFRALLFIPLFKFNCSSCGNLAVYDVS